VTRLKLPEMGISTSPISKFTPTTQYEMVNLLSIMLNQICTHELQYKWRVPCKQSK